VVIHATKPVEIEKKLESGGYIDVHLERQGDGEKVAVEVSVYPEVLREIRNIEKCLNAGYQKVLCLFLDRKVIPEAMQQATENWPDQCHRITIAGIDDLERLL
jgi:hypothetical protein